MLGGRGQDAGSSSSKARGPGSSSLPVKEGDPCPPPPPPRAIAPLSPSELYYWLDILGNFTHQATANRGGGDGGGDVRPDRPVRGAHNPLWQLPVRGGKPASSIKEWVESGRCKHADLYLAHILDKLEPWSNGGITRGMMETSLRLGLERSSFGSLHYQIVGSEVYGRAHGNDLYMDLYAGLLVHTLRHVALPDMEFALHNGKDLPVMAKHEVYPMLAYAGADAFIEVLVPCPWYVLELAKRIAEEEQEEEEGGGKAEANSEQERRKKRKPLMSKQDYMHKQSRAAWRGSPNDFLGLNKDNYKFAPRFKLVQYAKERPDLLDAEITSSLVLIQQAGWEFECFVYTELWGLTVDEGVGPCGPSTVSQYREAQEHKSLSSDTAEAKFRYSINLDGTGVSERYASQLLSPTTVFKVASPFYNYYSRFFTPYEHYIPVKYDLSDLIQQLEWANSHADDAYRIMVQASSLARDLFHPDEVTCYTALVLTAYARLLGYHTQLRDDVARFRQ